VQPDTIEVPAIATVRQTPKWNQRFGNMKTLPAMPVQSSPKNRTIVPLTEKSGHFQAAFTG
jgi:hypothetical protein